MLSEKQANRFLEQFTRELIRKTEKKQVEFHAESKVKIYNIQQENNTILNKILPITKRMSRDIQNPLISRPEMPTQITLQQKSIGDIKLHQLLADQKVQLLECPGPGRFIVVKVLNVPRITNITLNESEINMVIKDFSDKTRIPAINGVFKARYNNLYITAIISKFIPPRFIITKIAPSLSQARS